MSKIKKQPEDIVLPDFLTLPDGRFIINFSDLKTRSKDFIVRHKTLTFEAFVQILVESKENFRSKVKHKRCKKCKGSIFERGKEIEADVFVFVSWKCLNCGNIEPSRYLSDTFKKELENKEKEIDTDIVSTIADKLEEEE